jgi:hypothetical protein
MNNSILKALIPCAMVALNAKMVIEDYITPAAITNDNACIYLVVSRPEP